MISGFTLVRNGTQFGYPYLESLRSLLPLVDELVINVGVGDDDTWITLQKFAEHEGQGKVRLFESEWPLNDPEKRKGGLILSEQTNLALDRCKGDWCVYLQADEILHEADYPALLSAFATYADDSAVEGLLFDYVHFYGSFDVIQHSRSAYRREVRVVKKSAGARSVGDAQSFRKNDGSKLKVVRAGASIHHYGWVRPPEVMKEKTVFMDQLYHGKQAEASPAQTAPHSGDNYRYKKIWGLRPFRGVHPQVMQKRISEKKWNWNLKDSPLEWKWSDSKKVVLDTLERITGYRFFEYRSYRLTAPKKSTFGSSR